MKTSTLNKTLLLATTMSLLTACGAKRTEVSSTDFSSRAPVTDVNQAANKALALCNGAESTQLGVRNTVYMQNNQIRPDFLRARITKISDTFKDGTSYIQIFRWKANTHGQTYLDSNPLSFKVTYTSNNQDLTGYVNNLKYSQVSTLIEATKAASLQDFMNMVNLTIDLKDPQAEFDAIKVVLYNSSNQAIDQVDMLISAFAAHPNDYATESDGSPRSAILKNLHPFKDLANQGWSAKHFQTVSNSFCF